MRMAARCCGRSYRTWAGYARHLNEVHSRGDGDRWTGRQLRRLARYAALHERLSDRASADSQGASGD